MKRITRLAVLLPLIMVAAACGTSDDGANDDVGSEAVETTVAETPSETTESAPETTVPTADSEVAEESDAEVADDPVEEEEEMVYPSAIISLSPTATEMLYAVGAGDQVLAVDDFSNFPAETADKMPG